MIRRRTIRAMTIALAVALSALTGAQAAGITVFAASSLKTALDAIAADWTKRTGIRVTISYASSAMLARQIQQGAPADLFISAATNWMDVLQDDGLLADGTRRDILGNTLVLVASRKDAPPVTIASGLDLRGMLGGGKLSMALVNSVPAGQYGKEALENLGLWSSVEAQVAQSDNARAALALVASGEAPYGIVYGSDAIADDTAGDRVTVVGTFPEDSHRPIIYPAAVLAGQAKPEAQAFLGALSGGPAKAAFEQQGFTVLN